MTMSNLAVSGSPASSEPTTSPIRPATAEYRPGVCNIGPAEIAHRRRGGHIAAVATIVLASALLAIDAPPLTRLVVAIPAAGAASGYLQAWLRFCAGFGSRGVFNFGELGTVETVEDADARARDRRRSVQIGVASVGIGLVVGAFATVLPR